MRTALITTTINVPKVLALYRAAAGPEIAFFVAGDKREPDGIREFCESIDAEYLSFDDQFRKYPLLSQAIGPNCVQRRNFALLEALKWGAEIIITVDDDNFLLGDGWFWDFESQLATEFDGLLASSPSGWFDVGDLLIPNASHRGFPHDRRAQPSFSSVTNAKIGVAAGICLGDPDISAVTRIANAPIVHSVSEVLRPGVVTDPRTTWTVYNSQSTAFLRQFAPAMFMFPGVGRYDDIFASIICQRIMRETGHHVHFGPPFVWQQRNQHDLVKDLKAEVFGMERVTHLAGILEVLPHLKDNAMRQVLDLLNTVGWFPKQAVEAGLAFCDDVEKVL